MGTAEGFSHGQGAPEGRGHGPSHTGARTITYLDDLFRLKLRDDGTLAAAPMDTEAESGRGCKIVLAVGQTYVVYQHCSPSKSGDT